MIVVALSVVVGAHSTADYMVMHPKVERTRPELG